MKKMVVGSDHAGFKLKEALKKTLGKTYAIEDVGAYILDKDDDYPIIAKNLAREVLSTKNKGILICGSGQGVCIAANKIKGIRAVACTSVTQAKHGREHNDANVLCLSGWEVSPASASRIIRTFLNTRFSGAARHIRRVREIAEME